MPGPKGGGGLPLHVPRTGEVGARKGIFVPRELVDRLKMSVPLLDVEGLTIGVYVTRILLRHLSDNAGILNLLMEKGKKKTRL